MPRMPAAWAWVSFRSAMASAIRCTSLAFARHSSWLGTPRSAKTLPLLACTSIPFRRLFFFAGKPFRVLRIQDCSGRLLEKFELRKNLLHHWEMRVARPHFDVVFDAEGSNESV